MVLRKILKFVVTIAVIDIVAAAGLKDVFFENQFEDFCYWLRVRLFSLFNFHLCIIIIV